MDAESIRQFCLDFPGATENLQWGDDLCFKVRGKIFAIVSLENPRLCFKCAPDTFAELIERANIAPAPYVGRYKWVMLDRLDALRDGEMMEFIRQSYEIIEAKAPKSKAKEKQQRARSNKPAKRKPHAKKRSGRG